MPTLQSLLEKDKERFLNEINGLRSAETLIKKVDAELGRLLFLYNEKEESDSVKTASYSIIQSLRASASLVDSVKEAKLYSYTALNQEAEKRKISPRMWVFLGIGLGCGVAAAILLLMSVRAVQLVINLPLFAVLLAAALLFVFLAGLSAHGRPRKSSSQINVEIEYDADKVYRHLYSCILTADRMLEEIRTQETIDKRRTLENEKKDIDPHEISLLAQLLEDAYARPDNEFSTEVIQHIKYYLHNRNIDVLDEGDRSWFDTLPGEGGTVRPAIVMDQAVLKKGLTAGAKL
ncbi:MAG: hypothetical protein IKD71_03655 [Solobacterium sp.]|nr:hypothetical protein [Solobacterium sp.]